MSQASMQAVLQVPEMGFTTGMVTVSVWLVSEGDCVLAGDRVVQLVAGAATVDLLAPVTGRLARQLVDEDDPVEPGESLALFTATPAAEGQL